MSAHPAADALYVLGGWRILDIIEQLERDCEVPVLYAMAAGPGLHSDSSVPR